MNNESRLILIIRFLTLFGCGFKITPNSIPIMIPKTYVSHRLTEKQTEIINQVQRELISLRIKLMISFNRGKINTKAPE